MYIRLRQMFGIPANVHSVDRETLEVQKDTFRPENERRGNERPRRRPQGVQHEIEGGEGGMGEMGGRMWGCVFHIEEYCKNVIVRVFTLKKL